MAKKESLRRISAMITSRSNSTESLNYSPINISNSPKEQLVLSPKLSPGHKNKKLDKDFELSMDPAIEQLVAWKDQFQEKVLHNQEELIDSLLNKKVPNEELAQMITDSFSDFKLNISELLKTVTALINKFVNQSKSLLENSDMYWKAIILDLNSQLEYMARGRAVEEEKRKELEKEIKKLKAQIKLWKSTYKNTKNVDHNMSIKNSSFQSPRTPFTAKAQNTTSPSSKEKVVQKATPARDVQIEMKNTPQMKKDNNKAEEKTQEAKAVKKTPGTRQEKAKNEGKKEEEKLVKKEEEKAEKKEDDKTAKEEEKNKEKVETHREEEKSNKAQENIEKEVTKKEEGKPSHTLGLSVKERLALRRAAKSVDHDSAASNNEEETQNDRRSRIRDRIKHRREESISEQNTAESASHSSPSNAREKLRERLHRSES